MTTLYLDCGMGAAGDMLTAALLELHPQPQAFVDRLNALGMPGVHYEAVPSVKCGVCGTRMVVTVNGGEEGAEDGHEHPHPQESAHHHSGMEDIRQRVTGLDVPEEVRKSILDVYELIAQAESTVHGVPVTQIHFHEVGTWDAVADVTAVCLLMHELAPEHVAASPVHVGGGTVHCAHGVLPVPAPATALLLQGIPSVGGPVESELCTPTGAALLRYFVKEYGPQPAMSIHRIGYGCGRKDFGQANCVRAVLGESCAEDGLCGGHTEHLLSLECNLDDMTPEEIAFAMEELLAAGAMDVYTTAIGMKKNRPGILLTCICSEEQRDEMVRLMFCHTTTLGIRETEHPRRYALERCLETVETPYGTVRVKSSSGWGTGNVKAEYEDLAAIARRTGRPLKEISKEIKRYER